MKAIEGAYSKSISGVSLVTITRPANETPFSAGDVYGPAATANLTFANILPNTGQHFYIVNAYMYVVLATVPANMSTFTLHLFSSAQTAIADNAAWVLVTGDKDKYFGSITFSLPAVKGGVILWSQIEDINIKRKLDVLSNTIYGQLVTNGAYTPASAE